MAIITKTIKPDGTGDFTTLQDWLDWVNNQATADDYYAECYSGDIKSFIIGNIPNVVSLYIYAASGETPYVQAKHPSNSFNYTYINILPPSTMSCTIEGIKFLLSNTVDDTVNCYKLVVNHSAFLRRCWIETSELTVPNPPPSAVELSPGQSLALENCVIISRSTSTYNQDAITVINGPSTGGSSLRYLTIRAEYGHCLYIGASASSPKDITIVNTTLNNNSSSPDPCIYIDEANLTGSIVLDGCTSTDNSLNNYYYPHDPNDPYEPYYYTNQSPTDLFVDYANDDYHVKPTGNLFENALSFYSRTEDYEGTPTLAPYDIGAYELEVQKPKIQAFTISNSSSSGASIQQSYLKALTLASQSQPALSIQQPYLKALTLAAFQSTTGNPQVKALTIALQSQEANSIQQPYLKALTVTIQSQPALSVQQPYLKALTLAAFQSTTGNPQVKALTIALQSQEANSIQQPYLKAFSILQLTTQNPQLEMTSIGHSSNIGQIPTYMPQLLSAAIRQQSNEPNIPFYPIQLLTVALTHPEYGMPILSSSGIILNSIDPTALSTTVLRTVSIEFPAEDPLPLAPVLRFVALEFISEDSSPSVMSLRWVALETEHGKIKIRLQWQASESDDLDHYTIYKSELNQPVLTENAYAATQNTYFEDEIDVSHDGRYIYLVRAVDENGNEESNLFNLGVIYIKYAKIIYRPNDPYDCYAYQKPDGQCLLTAWYDRRGEQSKAVTAYFYRNQGNGGDIDWSTAIGSVDIDNDLTTFRIDFETTDLDGQKTYKFGIKIVAENGWDNHAVCIFENITDDIAPPQVSPEEMPYNPD